MPVRQPSHHCSRYILEALETRLQLATFAIIGDVSETTGGRDVSNLVKGWNPEFVVSTGDNVHGDALDDTIGQFYHSYVSPYIGGYGSGSSTGNRFWSALGNHDYDNGISDDLAFFSFPNNERYYNVRLGSVELFIVNSNPQESAGTTSTSTQGTYIKNALAASTATWKLVFFHFPAYTSGTEDNHASMQWPFQQWGATAVFSGHDHMYERILKNGFPYFVNGLAGAAIVPPDHVEPGSQIRYSGNYGAIRVDTDPSSITFRFINRNGTLIDSYSIGTPTPTLPAAPTGIIASPRSTAEVQLTWNDSSTGSATSFQIERSTDNVNFGHVASVGSSVTSFLDTGRTPGTTYYYRVRASNAAGSSGYSGTASVALPSGNLFYLSDLNWAGSPTNGYGPVEKDMSNGGTSAGDGKTITLNGVTYAKGLGAHAASDITYNLGGAYSFFHSDIGADDATGATSGLVFQVYADGVKVYDSGSMSQSTQSKIINLNVTGVQQLRLHVGDNDGDLSYDHADWAGAYLVAPGTPPTTPANLSAMVVGATQVNLTWTDSTGESSYFIERSTNNSTFAQIGTAPANATSYSDTTVASATTYYYRIRAGNGMTSDYSNTVNVSTPAAPTPPAVPTNLTAAASSGSLITLAWLDNSSNETGFKIERSRDGSGSWAVIATVGSNVTAYQDSNNVLPSTTYYYRVRSANFAGDSAASSVASATTPAAPASTAVTYIPTGSTWKYLDDGSDQGAAWFGAGFDDSAWRSGAAQFGYGDGDEATVISYGPSVSSRYITTYFRRTFTVTDPGKVSALTLRLLRDDGAVVYLNGTEIYRSNMPTGAVSYTTNALSSVEDNNYYSASVNPALVASGSNVIAVELHQSDPTSSDVSFDFELQATLAGTTPPPPSTQNLIAAGSTWKYLDNGSNQGTSWRSTVFSDTAWKTGAAQLGYGDGDEATLVSYGTNANSKYVTTYFRKAFSVSNPTQISALALKLIRDDGAVVYLNGTEIYRSNMPTGTVAYNTLASTALGGSDETTWLSANVNPALLVAGTNVIAVEIHQAGATSTDISFDFQLIATVTTTTASTQLAQPTTSANLTTTSVITTLDQKDSLDLLVL
ncbi:MAG TPA: NPCBM/NEW2 domain-containing protein [Tepidisphaeraceae bacterium]